MDFDHSVPTALMFHHQNKVIITNAIVKRTRSPNSVILERKKAQSIFASCAGLSCILWMICQSVTNVQAFYQVAAFLMRQNNDYSKIAAFSL